MAQATPLVTYRWCQQTGGALTDSQRRLLLGRSLRTFGSHAGDLVRLALGGRSAESVTLPTVSRSGVIDAAMEASADQGPDLAGHGLRTWLFGGALATLDAVELDPDLFCIAAIVHDAGGAVPMTGQDFTVRSADIAATALHAIGEHDPAHLDRVRDGVVAHATAGVTAEESAIGTYVQAGAMLDLAGVRLIDLPAEVVEEVYSRHPAGSVRRTIVRLIKEEARAVPDGRFAQLRRLGLTVAVRTSPSLKGR